MTTILIVDDVPDIRDLFTTFLTNAGFSTMAVGGGAECLELLKTTRPDLILLDIMMEPMDGWQTLQLIKSQPETKDIPVMMVTGKGLIDSEKQEHSGQFEIYMMKPVTPKKLQDSIADILKSQ
jgi:two-component system, OmpR family, response regulator